MSRSRMTPRKAYRSWPRPRPGILGLRLSAPSVRFIALAIFATGVRAFECALRSLTCSFDHGLFHHRSIAASLGDLVGARLEETLAGYLIMLWCSFRISRFTSSTTRWGKAG